MRKSKRSERERISREVQSLHALARMDINLFNDPQSALERLRVANLLVAELQRLEPKRGK